MGCHHLSTQRDSTSIPTLKYTKEQEMITWNDPANLGGFPPTLTPQLFRNAGDVGVFLCSLALPCLGQAGNSLVRSQGKGGSSPRGCPELRLQKEGGCCTGDVKH